MAFDIGLRHTRRMDVNYFLHERADFIRQLYDTATAPMVETKRRIDAKEAPFDNPPYCEDGQPAFLDEWLQADAQIEVLGRTGVSMLSEALKQFFVNWEKRTLIGDRPCQKECRKAFEGGFLAGYRVCFTDAFGLDWATCPANLDVVEQVVLARNRAQHGDLILNHIEHDDATRSKFPRPFFMRPDEPTFDDGDPTSFMYPMLHINRETLFHAIAEVEQLCSWLQEGIGHWEDKRWADLNSSAPR